MYCAPLEMQGWKKKTLVMIQVGIPCAFFSTNKNVGIDNVTLSSNGVHLKIL